MNEQSFMPPLEISSPANRRANVSYVVTNDSIREGRRFWDRYIEENERQDRERERGEKANSATSD